VLIARSQRFQDGQAESSLGGLLSCSDSERLALVLMHTCALFFCSSLGLLGCDILGPIDGSTPLRANSSKSTRSTSLSPYVKILNYIASATTDAFSPRGDSRTPQTDTYFPRILGGFAKPRPHTGGFARRPLDPSASPVLGFGRHLKVIIHQRRRFFRMPWAAHGAGERERNDTHRQPSFQ